MINHYELHRALLGRERELLEKRAEYEARVDDAIAAIKLDRRERAAARGSRRPGLRFDGIRPIRWVMLRLSQSGGRP
jgi:hypothetical protein